MCVKMLREDIQTVYKKDPAARNLIEILLCYPGMHAIWSHRFANWMWRHHLFLISRLVSLAACFFTGIEIHPGATIGRRFFIDHGTGVVIGETAEVGDDVLMYQGAVLGGTSLNKGKRHPTIGHNVVIGAGAIVLGPVTIGDGSRIGSGSVVVKPVPPMSTVVGVPGRVISSAPLADQLEHGKLVDPFAESIHFVLIEQERLSERLAQLEVNIQAISQGRDVAARR